MTDTAEWVGTTLCDGRYRVLRKLGEGGMAHVYLAHDDKLEREVVIKVARSNLVHDVSFSGRFTREVRSLAKLSHPHIVPLIDIGEHDKAPFAVYYLTGGSLRDRQPCENNKPLPAPAESLGGWLPAIAQALDFVHKNKFIHRDVKPENILFDADGQPFLADLGIIKALSEPEDPNKRTVFTGAGMVLGTPQYMAPELILGEEVDGRVDQYALAVTVYELLAGKPPFGGTSAPAIFIQQTTKPPQPLSEIAPNLPAALVAAVDKALSKSPKERFATCVDFVHAALGHGSQTLPPPVAKTILEPGAAQDPIFATLLESRPSTSTPSNLRNPTRAETAPSARPVTRSSRKVLALVVGMLALAGGGALAYLFLPARPAPTSIKLAAVQPLALMPGDKQPIRVEFQREHLDGEVTLWVEGLPEGMKAERVSVPKDQSKGHIDLSVANTVAAGKTSLTLKAKSESAEDSVPVEVVVSVPAASLRFLPIGPCTLEAGKTVKVPIKVERQNCDGPVALEVENLPKGVIWYRPGFLSKEILAKESTYELQLKADRTVESGEATVKVAGKLKSLDAVAGLTLTVNAARETIEPKIKDVVETPPEKKKEPNVVIEPKKQDPPIPVFKGPPDLRVAPILGITLRPGERFRIWVQIDRINCAGPVDVSLTGLPVPGVTVSPSPLPAIPETRLALPIDVVVAPDAPPTKRFVTVAVSLGKVRKTTSFNFAVEDVREVLWQKTDRMEATDPLDRVRRQSRSKTYPIPLKADKTYDIEMTSDAIDSYLRVENKDGVQLVADDNGGGGLNARITFVPRESGVHYLIATSGGAGEVGPFTIKIR